MNRKISTLNRILKEKYGVDMEDEELQNVLDYYVEFILDLIGDN